MMGSLGEESLVLFFLFLRLVLGVVATLALFLPKAVVKVVEVAEIPMVVVVVALGGSIGTSASVGDEWGQFRNGDQTIPIQQNFTELNISCSVLTYSKS